MLTNMLVISLHKKFVTVLLEVVFFHRNFENNIVLNYTSKNLTML